MSSLAASFVVLDPRHPSTEPDYIPGATATYAHDWSKSGIAIEGRHFVDRFGRVCHLRGVNLSGNCKSPSNHDAKTFPAHPEIATFVNRPFALEDAPEHFARLRRWGLTFIRFLVTWEALCPSSPTEFSTPYLTYLRSLLSLLPNFGLIAYVSLHQDVWSRYSGGSGAPCWTLSAVGFDVPSLEPTGAAWLKGHKGGGHVLTERGLWPTGYHKLAASTMATCFWAGETFAPKLKVKDPKGEGEVGVQAMLQDAFLDAWEALVRAVGDLEGVVGFQMMNEPHPGYVNLPSLYSFNYNTELHMGEIPSALSSFVLGAGHSATVPYYSRSFPMPTKMTRYVALNVDGKKAWRDDGPTKGRCLWEMHGVWGWDDDKQQGVALRENYFKQNPQTGEKVTFYTDFYFPFLRRWVNRVRSVPGAESKMIFVEAIPNEFCPRLWTEEYQFERMVYAPHWYDLYSLFNKSYGNLTVNVQGVATGLFLPLALYWGHASARDNYALQIGTLAKEAYISLGEKPVVLGESGIPMDMNESEAFRTGNFKRQAMMMDALITGVERNLIGFNLWNYNPDNTNHDGDAWNGENFSWFGNSHKRTQEGRSFPSLSSLHVSPIRSSNVSSRNTSLSTSPASDSIPLTLPTTPVVSHLASHLLLAQSNKSLDDGARILRSVMRPYPAKVAGTPLRWSYELNSGRLEFTWSEARPRSASGSDLRSKVNLAEGEPEPDSDIRCRETEIFFPNSLLEEGRKLIVQGLSDEEWSYDREGQTVFIVPAGTNGSGSGPATRSIIIHVEPPLEPLFEMTTHWKDFGKWYMLVLTLVFAIMGYWVV